MSAAGEPAAGPELRSGACRSGRAIIAATLALLAEQGFERLTIDAIAARAGVGKATIYRHWRSKAELVIEACGCLPGPAPAPDTGCLRDDLRAAVGHLVAVLADPGHARIVGTLVDAAQRDAELAELHGRFTAQRRMALEAVLRAAVGRGEIDPDVDIGVAIDLLAGSLFYRRLICHDAVTADFVDRVVESVATLLGAPAPASP